MHEQAGALNVDDEIVVFMPDKIACIVATLSTLSMHEDAGQVKCDAALIACTSNVNGAGVQHWTVRVCLYLQNYKAMCDGSVNQEQTGANCNSRINDVVYCRMPGFPSSSRVQIPQARCHTVLKFRL